jgi:hypothetical protein
VSFCLSYGYDIFKRVWPSVGKHNERRGYGCGLAQKTKILDMTHDDLTHIGRHIGNSLDGSKLEVLPNGNVLLFLTFGSRLFSLISFFFLTLKLFFLSLPFCCYCSQRMLPVIEAQTLGRNPV